MSDERYTIWIDEVDVYEAILDNRKTFHIGEKDNVPIQRGDIVTFISTNEDYSLYDIKARVTWVELAEEMPLRTVFSFERCAP